MSTVVPGDRDSCHKPWLLIAVRGIMSPVGHGTRAGLVPLRSTPHIPRPSPHPCLGLANTTFPSPTPYPPVMENTPMPAKNVYGPRLNTECVSPCQRSRDCGPTLGPDRRTQASRGRVTRSRAVRAALGFDGPRLTITWSPPNHHGSVRPGLDLQNKSLCCACLGIAF